MTGPARAFWLRTPGVGEIRPVALREPGPGEVRVRTTRSGVSRGTEALVFRGGVPADQYAAMRAPFQEGEFPAPVKYGYLSVGVIDDGPANLRGRRVFCLHPHQSAYVVPTTAVVPIPDDVPDDRAVLAGTVETAINALWDVPPLIGDRVAVVGAGMVGLCLARILVGIPGVHVTVVDVDPQRETAARALGADFAHPADAPGDRDLVVHASATGAGLQLSLDLLTAEGVVLDVSWYGDADVTLRLGGAFHSRRLSIREPGRHHRASPPHGAHDAATPRPRPAPAARPGVRRPAHRQFILRRPARGHAAAGLRGAPGAVPHDHLPAGGAVTCSA
ncbi:zinc-dependent alcohol dehydrogenase [Kribbia dieselivorans]|uniref:zinc-dependent alcohol dehydrogenase n=1 Tax=Kribbia dieselivorans TaxID=331526 RepID=UPI000A8E888E|nr:zinc-binding alcohol dehydrogenase [Kribbia dieselivorans]